MNQLSNRATGRFSGCQLPDGFDLFKTDIPKPPANGPALQRHRQLPQFGHAQRLSGLIF